MLVFGYLLILLVMLLMENSLIYFPAVYPEGIWNPPNLKFEDAWFEAPDGTRLHGGEAFVAMWQRLPGWRWLARLAGLPGVLPMLERAYSGFLRMRPRLHALAQRAARRV